MRVISISETSLYFYEPMVELISSIIFFIDSVDDDEDADEVLSFPFSEHIFVYCSLVKANDFSLRMKRSYVHLRNIVNTTEYIYEVH